LKVGAGEETLISCEACFSLFPIIQQQKYFITSTYEKFKKFLKNLNLYYHLLKVKRFTLFAVKKRLIYNGKAYTINVKLDEHSTKSRILQNK